MLASDTGVTVTVKFMGDLPAVIGQRSLELEMPVGSTAGNLLARLCETYGEAFRARVFATPDKLHHYILIFVGGKNIKGNGEFDMPLNGDVDVVMLPMFGGG